eukprot:881395_1
MLKPTNSESSPSLSMKKNPISGNAFSDDLISDREPTLLPYFSTHSNVTNSSSSSLDSVSYNQPNKYNYTYTENYSNCADDCADDYAIPYNPPFISSNITSPQIIPRTDNYENDIHKYNNDTFDPFDPLALPIPLPLPLPCVNKA